MDNLEVINKKESLVPDYEQIEDVEEARIRLVLEQAKLTQIKRLKLEGKLIDKIEVQKEWIRGLKSIKRNVCGKCSKIIDSIIKGE